MAVYIYEPNAFDKICMVEGKGYRAHKEDYGPCSFDAFF